ncbi:PTS system fructose-specific EIIABC component [subsurface metagenome]
MNTAPDIVPLSRLIREDLILMSLDPGTKEELLRQLIRPLILMGIIQNSSAFLEKLLKREAMVSTAFGRGAAIPHIRNPRENPQGGPLLVIGICKEGTDFDALDGGKTHLFFLLYTDSEVIHLRAMAKLTGMLRNRNLVTRLLFAKDREEIMHIILEFEQEEKE